jgi:hypothetical protein
MLYVVRMGVAFQIIVSGKPFCQSEDLDAVTMVAEERPRRDGCRVSLHARAGEAPVQWLATHLGVGDEIVVRLVETEDLEAARPQGCSFCGREACDVGSLVMGPSSAICDGCIRGFSEALTGGGTLPLGATIRDGPEWVCAFCDNRPGAIAGVIVRNGVAICPECLRASRDILVE